MLKPNPFSGCLDKMQVKLLDNMAHYSLTVFDPKEVKHESTISLNPYIGKKISLKFSGDIFCSECGKKTKKSYGQGFCYPCTLKLAACDICIMKPELCHFDKGTCREPEWAKTHCFVDHIVYLANSSGLKVGITRATQVPTRFIDQGASYALPIFKVKSRYMSGVIEKLISSELNDKTDWRKMLKGSVEEIDLFEKRDEVVEIFERELEKIEKEFQSDIEFLEDAELIEIQYPVNVYPEKISSLSFDKTPTIEGVLKGIKGQYLYFDHGVINLRNHSSYFINFEVEE